jgi:hypothetical protein
MIDRLSEVVPRKSFLIGITLSVIGAVMVSLYTVGQGLDYRALIVVLAALIGGIIVFGGERGVRFGFVLWTLTLALGYRTIAYSSDLKVHPAEILLWLLLCCVLAQRQLLAGTRLLLPFWIWLFLPFWVLAWWPLIAGDAPWDKMLNEFRNFLLIVPLLIIAAVTLRRRQYWRYLLLGLVVASTWIALMGIVEYWFPQVTQLFPAFIKDAKAEATADGFVRATFSFYGGASAVFVCVLALPSTIILATWWRNLLPRLAIYVAAVLQILAIYIGGYRSIWFVLLIQVVTACVLRLKKYGVVIALLCLVVGVGGYRFIPNTNERVISGMAALQGAPIDHSAQDRKNRALGAFDSAMASPFGTGWGTAGWVHSDFLQVAANLGIFGGLIFLGGYIYTLLRLLRRLLPYLRKGDLGDLGFSLFLSFIAVGGLLTMEGVSVLPQLILPVWFVWTLVEVWLQQTPDLRLMNDTVAPAYSSPLTPLDNPAGY